MLFQGREGGGSGVTEVGEGGATDGRQRLSGEGGEKEMSADPASHTHTGTRAHTHTES